MKTLELTITVSHPAARSPEDIATDLNKQASLIREAANGHSLYKVTKLIDAASILDGLANAARNGGRAQ
jgi:hypothetical protein